MKEILKNRQQLCIWLIFVLTAIVQAICLIPIGDDFLWAVDGREDFQDTGISANGRYFTNALTHLMARNNPAKWALYILFSVLMLYCITKMIRKSDRLISAAFACLSLFLVPSEIYQNIISWLSGFTNYYVGAVCLLLYFVFCGKILRGEALSCKKTTLLYTLVLGFVSSLCVENQTILNLAFSVFIIVLSLVRFKKLHPACAAHLVGALAGLVLMLSNESIVSILGGEEDKAGFRFTDFDLMTMFSVFYKDLVKYYAKPFALAHIVIAVSLLILFGRKFSGGEKRPKYALPALVVVLVFAVYSTLSSSFHLFTVTSAAYREQALECALTFLYFVSLLYLGCVLLERFSFTRLAVYLCSSLLSVLPFLVVKPVSSRCFFLGGIFWALAAGELLTSAFEGTNWEDTLTLKLPVFVGVAGCALVLCLENIMNKYAEKEGIRYLKEQLRAGKTRNVEILSFPYPDLAMDTLFDHLVKNVDETENDTENTQQESTDETDEKHGGYYDAIKAYYELDDALDDVTGFIKISLYDYTL